MGWYDSEDDGQAANIRTWALQNSVEPGPVTDNFLVGGAKGLGLGLAQSVAQASLASSDFFTPKVMPLAKSIDDYFGGSSIQDYLKADQQKAAQNVRDLMPGPNIGLAGNLTYGLASTIPQAVVGGTIGALAGPGGAAAGAAAVTGYLQGHAAMRMGETYEGLDADTAYQKGLIEGGAAALGVVLPAAKAGSLATRVLTGAAYNVPVGMAQRGATGALLESRGYTKQAEQYRAMDAEAILVDVALGGALGGMLGPRAAKPSPSTVDAALALDKQHHLEVSTAPGVPADPASTSVHAKAINQAVSDVMANKPVDVAQTGVDSGVFVPNKTAMQAAVEAAVNAEGKPLGSLLDELAALRAEVEARGLTPVEGEFAFAGEKLQAMADQLDAAGARDLPGQVRGRDGEVFVGEKPQPVRFLVVEASSLAATIKKADNQFRDRTRASSVQQVAKIAGDLQFGRLGESPSMAEGAPTLAQSGEIVGGNGRVAAIQQAYERGLGDAYKAALGQRAAEFGLTPAQIAGMSQPVLVRQFTAPVDVKAAAILSNESAGLRMSALEQAKVDAERMPALPELPESGDLGAASLRDFVNSWLSRYPQSELGEFTDADGRLSPQGEKRLQGAVLFKAYGDSPTLARLIEATDDLSRNLTNALVKAAPTIADTRAAMERGDLHDLDIQPHLLDAVDLTQKLKQTGQKLDDYLAQHDIFGDQVGPETTLLAQHFAKNARSAKALGQGLTDYYDRVRALGDPRQETMFAMPPPPRGELLKSVLEGKPAEPELALSERADLAEGFTLEGARVDLPAPDARTAQAVAALAEGIGRKVKNFSMEPARSVPAEQAQGLQAAVDIAERLFGKTAAVVDQPGRKVFNGAAFESFPDHVFLAADSQRPHMAILGHELVHMMRRDHPELYASLARDMGEALIGQGAYAKRVNESRAKKGLDPLDAKEITEEMIGDTSGDMFLDGNFWLEFQKADEKKFRTIAGLVHDFILDTMRRIDGLMALTGWRPFKSEAILADMDAARKTLAKHMAEYSKKQKGEAKEPAAPPGGDVITFPDGTTIDASGMEVIVAQAMDDKPNMRVITDLDYPTSAALEGERVDLTIERADQDAPGYTAAAACAVRTGT